MDAQLKYGVTGGCFSLETMPCFDGVVIVEMPPDWKSDEPTLYSFVFTSDELSAHNTRKYYQVLANSGLPNPRLFTPQAVALASLFHPLFWSSVERGHRLCGIPSRLSSARLLVSPTVDTVSGCYFLQSLLFLSGVTLSAAIIQNRWSGGTIESKLARLWHAGKIAESLDLAALKVHGLQDLVRSRFAPRSESAGCDLLLELKETFAVALRSVTKGLQVNSRTISPAPMNGGMRDRFAFANDLVAQLGSNLRSIIVYGSSVTSDRFADYDLILVVEQPTAALELLAGKHPTYRGLQLNISVYSMTDFWTYQIASGDNLTDHALCLVGEIDVPVKSVPDLLVRNYSFAFIRLRQLLGMAAFASTHALHTEQDDKSNLYGYFTKIPLNIAKGTRAAIGKPISKDAISNWLSRTIEFDYESLQSWCVAGRAGDAIATAAWGTQRVIQLLNSEDATYESEEL